MSIVIKEPTEFLCEKNHYLINGVKYWRVTRVKSIIANPGLVNWQITQGKKKAYEIMTTQAKKGTRIHKLIKLVLEDEIVHHLILNHYLDKETQVTIKLFQDFLDEHDVKPECLEQHLWSKDLGFAGTADFIGYVDGKLMILDWKTSKAIYDDMWLQLSAYVWALNELTGESVDAVGILQIRDGKKKFETRTYDEICSEFEIFEACLKIWKRYRVKND